MGLTAKINKRNSSGEGWGMGFFLVFFPQEQSQSQSQSQLRDFDSSSPFKSPAFLRRTNSSHILTRAQSTIYICALLIFLTLLLFTHSTFEPHNNFHHYRRHLSQNHPPKPTSISPALQGLGTLYTRGTWPMNDLLLCHVTESVSPYQVKFFLRAFHRSGLPSKSDLVFVFPSISTPVSFDNVIREENELFLKLIRRYNSHLGNGSKVFDFPASFDVSQLFKSGKKAAVKGEPIWGRKIKSSFNWNSSSSGGETDLTRPSYGSVVGFGVGELDPENSLSGFLEHVPMSLRRWASYPMILGRLRRNFKHVMLVDVKEVLLLGDPLGRVRNRSPESVFFSSTPSPQPLTKHGRKSSDKTHQKTVNPALIMGGARGVRRLSAAMLTEIVRATTHQQHSKRKGPVTESVLLSRLAANEFVQKSIRLVASGESIAEASALSGVSIANHTAVRRGNSNLDIDALVMEHICSFSIDSSLFTDCGEEPRA